jgi:hypothetical protein
MILIAPPDKPFSLTAKGSVRRTETLSNFTLEIEGAYKLFLASPRGDYDLHSHGGVKGITKAIIEEALGHDIVPDRDFFQQGCDR